MTTFSAPISPRALSAFRLRLHVLSGSEMRWAIEIIIFFSLFRRPPGFIFISRHYLHTIFHIDAIYMAGHSCRGFSRPECLLAFCWPAPRMPLTSFCNRRDGHRRRSRLQLYASPLSFAYFSIQLPSHGKRPAASTSLMYFLHSPAISPADHIRRRAPSGHHQRASGP